MRIGRRRRGGKGGITTRVKEEGRGEEREEKRTGGANKGWNKKK